jgi:preprotein translocase subunit SecE
MSEILPAAGCRLRVTMKVAMFENVKAETITGWWGRLRTFLTEVRNELKRVSWPSSKEVYATTFVVILTSIFFGVYLFGLDLFFNRVVQWIFTRFGA